MNWNPSCIRPRPILWIDANFSVKDRKGGLWIPNRAQWNWLEHFKLWLLCNSRVAYKIQDEQLLAKH